MAAPARAIAGQGPCAVGREGQQGPAGLGPSGTRAALEAWLAVRGPAPGALFFWAFKGGRLSMERITDEAVAIVLTTRVAEAGVSACTPHDMRRTYISELLDAGADITTMQKLVGHEQVTTTASYDRRGEAAKRKAVELIHVPFFSRPG
jgi:site-specific recombinase XerC